MRAQDAVSLEQSRVAAQLADVVLARLWPDAAIALSLANLSYLRVWSELLTYSAADTYTMKLPPSPAAYLAAVLNVLLVGAILWPLVSVVRRKLKGRDGRLARWVFLLSLAVPLNAMRSVLSNHFPYLKSPLLGLLGQQGVILAGAAVAVLGILLILFWSRQLTRAATAVLLMLSPFAAVTFAQAAWMAIRYDPVAFRDGAPAQPLPHARREPRALWVIFDEWDQRLAFIDRKPGLSLPEFDRFRAQSLYAWNAYSPGPETMFSMPALITGRLVSGVQKAGPSEMLLSFDGAAERLSWSAQPNIFSRAREAGFNTAVAGWYHPYCRVMSSSLTACWWWEMGRQHNSMGNGLGQILVNQTRSLFETSLLSLFGQSLSTRQQIRTYEAMIEKANQIAADPKYGLILVHFPVPHAPHFYNLKTGRADLSNSPINGYHGSLKAADNALGRLRRAMERAGLWDKTAVLLSSDHSYRGSPALDGKMDHRIPFMLKLAGQREGLDFEPPFNTVLSADLLLAILRGEIAAPRAAANWLDERRTIGDSPYNYN